MEITMTSIQTLTGPNPLAPSTVRPASGLGMPTGGQSCFGVLADQRASWIPATGLSFETTETAIVRDRKDLAAKGHVAFAAYVPGYLAWSPPIC